MFIQRRRSLSQVFFKNQILVHELVRNSLIGKKDTVIEIGPGKGIITEELLQVAGKVVTVEIDHNLYQSLQSRLRHANHFKLHRMDFLHYRLPLYPYKVFANIPFSIEGKIVRKLLDSPNPPEDCYLVMRKDFALRLSGLNREGALSISYKPWFEFEIVHRFDRHDFIPRTNVQTVMVRVIKSKSPLLPVGEKDRFTQFVQAGFSGGKSIGQSLKNVLNYYQINKLGRLFGFNQKHHVSRLGLVQWIGMYKYAVMQRVF